MAALPKTNMNYRPYQAFTLTSGFALIIPPNVGLAIITSTAALTGANTITLPDNAADGDEYYIVSQQGASGVTVGVSAQAAANGVTILAGPSAVTALTAGTQVGYVKVRNSWLRIQ
jgi:hypothetical protein